MKNLQKKRFVGFFLLSFLACGLGGGVASGPSWDTLQDEERLQGPLFASAFDLSNAHAYPVPFRPSVSQEIIFTNLSTEATIRIYTLSGELVKTLHENNGDGLLRWKVINDDGEPLGSDVFVYVIVNGEETKTGKLVIVK